MGHTVNFNGATTEQWNDVFFNGTRIHNIIVNGSQTYKYLSMSYSQAIPDRTTCCGCAAGWEGANMSVSKINSSQYTLTVTATGLRADYAWNYTNWSSSITTSLGQGATTEISWRNGRDRIVLRVYSTFESSGQVKFEVYGRCKDANQYTLVHTYLFEG